MVLGNNGHLYVWLLTACLIGLLEARSFSSDEYFPESFVKRNSWWSKKSTNNLPDTVKESIESRQSCDCGDTLQTFKCYSSECVPEFIVCTRNADNERMNDMCRVEHSLCAARCLGTEPADTRFS